ncbi:replication factor C large subunit [Candidatus Woesearchaeota archaeon]|nr:replication factor C large subunit [Candidatus Woesearchaeota archaeon]MBW2994161.1 replication factor C large subunit [Candidatus Woesearchaeota archaeon]
MVPWIKKYSPVTVCAVPQANAVKLKQFVQGFKQEKKNSVFLYGPPGSCKSCAVHALAKELGLEIVEINASDVRNAEQINEKIGNVLKQQSLFFRGKIVLVDEVDGVSGTKDRGGIPALVKLIEKSAFPVVMTANDPWNKKFNKLRSCSVLIEFDSPTPEGIADVLKNVCEKEKIEFDDSSLKTLARRSGGDLRAAINDLQSLTQGTKKLTKDVIESLGERNRQDSVNNALVKIFKSSDPAIAVSAFNDVNMNLDEALLWVEYNCPREYTKPQDVARAFDALSRADVYKGRIRKRQHWRFLVYVNALISAGVAVAKEAKYAGAVKYVRSTRLLKLWQAKMKYGQRKAIVSKIAEKTHCSSRRALESSLPYIRQIFKNNPVVADQISAELDLDEKEIGWLKK